jgi:hypothetical protein
MKSALFAGLAAYACSVSCLSANAGEVDFTLSYGRVRDQLIHNGWEPAAYIVPSSKDFCKIEQE